MQDTRPATHEAIQQRIDQEYKWGFVTDIEAESAPPGLNEEIVRFRSHVELFLEALDGDGSEPVGKRLGFLVQEMQREANTIGSKANDSGITHASVTLKEEIERIREQVENVE